GTHPINSGRELDSARVSGPFKFTLIVIRRRDRTISERIDFVGPTVIDRPLAEFGAFVQDRWTLNKNLTIDAGLRLDRNSIANHSDVSPRLSILYHPFKDERTIVRAGIGLFYDRSPLQSRYFELENL